MFTILTCDKTDVLYQCWEIVVIQMLKGVNSLINWNAHCITGNAIIIAVLFLKHFALLTQY